MTTEWSYTTTGTRGSWVLRLGDVEVGTVTFIEDLPLQSSRLMAIVDALNHPLEPGSEELPLFQAVDYTPERHMRRVWDTDETWTTSDVIRATGATMRQIVWWIEQDMIPGQGDVGSGNPRRWTIEQVERARQLRDAADIKRLTIAELADRDEEST